MHISPNVIHFTGKSIIQSIRCLAIWVAYKLRNIIVKQIEHRSNNVGMSYSVVIGPRSPDHRPRLQVWTRLTCGDGRQTSKHETQTQYRYHAGPPSVTLKQHWYSIGQTKLPHWTRTNRYRSQKYVLIDRLENGKDGQIWDTNFQLQILLIFKNLRKYFNKLCA